MSAVNFADLGLAPELLQALAEAGYIQPTPVQVQAIPPALAGNDLMACAQTGTGKTAAFALPLLQRWLPYANTSTSPARHPVRALILVPTRELAIQVEENIRAYAKYTRLRSLVVFGGVDIKTQATPLRNGVEVLVATPGRLLDHVEQKNVQLGTVQTLVLDEADRMLDMGFLPDLKRILALLPRQRQSMMFSATFSPEIRKLSEDFLVCPTRIEVARSNTSNGNITQKVYWIDADQKHRLLVELLRVHDVGQVIVFANTKLAVSRLARQLRRDGIAADALHGDKSQNERIQVLEAFRLGKVTTLVATDVAARGLDIDNLPMVINYELPHAAEDYVHRIGRTGRAGARGLAVSLASPEEEKHLAAIEKLIGRQIDRERAAWSGRDGCAHRHRAAAWMPQKAAREAWFDKPCISGSEVSPAPSRETDALSQQNRTQIPALMRRRNGFTSS